MPADYVKQFCPPLITMQMPVLSSTFRAARLAPDVLNTEALLSLLSYTSSIAVAFSEMRASLLDLYPDGARLEGTADGE